MRGGDGSGEGSFCSHQAWGFFLRVTLGWRHRVAGGAPPASGEPSGSGLDPWGAWRSRHAPRPRPPSFQVLIAHCFQRWSLQRNSHFKMVVRLSASEGGAHREVRSPACSSVGTHGGAAWGSDHRPALPAPPRPQRSTSAPAPWRPTSLSSASARGTRTSPKLSPGPARTLTSSRPRLSRKSPP